MKSLLVALLVGVAVLVGVGCAGQQAREHVLLPAMKQAWPGIKADAKRGGAEERVLKQFESALLQGDRLAVSARWPGIATSAQEGIDVRVEAGEISEGVAKSLRERVRKFGNAVQSMHGRPQ